jgi:glucuronate isomerase
MPFIHEDFLLSNATARRLYHRYAEAQPIIDYHCHLSPQDVAENRRFANLFEIWLEGDHYKWRAMRANGIEEQYCTGDADPYEKFLAWARTVPYTLRNPLYHWTHLELKRYFGVEELLDESTARRIWSAANEKLDGEELRAQAILKKFHVKALCTTDDPTDDLAWHKMIRDSGLGTHLGGVVLQSCRLDLCLVLQISHDLLLSPGFRKEVVTLVSDRVPHANSISLLVTDLCSPVSMLRDRLFE